MLFYQKILFHARTYALSLLQNRRKFVIMKEYPVKKLGRLAQLARAPRLHRGGLGFESLTAHHRKIRTQSGFFLFLLKSLSQANSFT